MAEYRLYLLDRYSGHIVRAESFRASDDVAAIHQVQQSNRAEPLELWCAGRKVSHFDGRPEIAETSRPSRPVVRAD